MAASGSLPAFSSVLSSNSSPQSTKNLTHSHAAEAEVFAICACAGVSCIGITRDLVIFQPHIASLSIPLAAFADPAKAIALIRAKLAEVQR